MHYMYNVMYARAVSEWEWERGDGGGHDALRRHGIRRLTIAAPCNTDTNNTNILYGDGCDELCNCITRTVNVHAVCSM